MGETMSPAKLAFLEARRLSRMRQLRWSFGDPRAAVYIRIPGGSPMTVQRILARYVADPAVQSF